MKLVYSKPTDYFNDVNTLFFLKVNGATVSNKSSTINLTRTGVSSCFNSFTCTCNDNASCTCTNNGGSSCNVSVRSSTRSATHSGYSKFSIKPEEVGDYKENYPISHYTTTVTTIISATEISFEGFTDNGGCTPPQSKSCPEVSGTMWSVNPNNGNDYNLTNTTCAKIKKTGNYYVYPQKTSTVSICEHFNGKFSVSN